MSSRHPFDEHFRKGLGKQEMPIPNGIWNNIEKELRKNRFRTILPWLLAFSIVVIAGGVYYFSGQYVTDDNANARALNKSEDQNTQSNDKVTLMNKKEEQLSEIELNIYKEKNKIKSNIDNDQVKEASSGTFPESIKKYRASSALNNNTEIELASQTGTLISENSEGNNQFHQDENLIDKVSVNNSIDNTIDSRTGFNVRSLDKITSYRTDMLSYKELPLSKLRNLRDRNCDDQSFNPGKIFLEFSYGAYKGSMNFHTTDAQFEEYRDLRDKGEVFKSGSNLQALVGFQIGKRLYFKTGISYTRVVSDYLFIDQINKRIITDTIFDPNTGQIKEVRTREEDITYQGKNDYTFVEIPLLLTYGWQFNKLGIGLTTGPMINLSFSREGELPNQNGQGIDLNDGEWNELGIYRRTAGLSWIAGLQFSYQTYRNVELFVEPRIVAGLNSITLEDDGLQEDVAKRAYPLSQRLFQYGVNVGLRYIINDN